MIADELPPATDYGSNADAWFTPGRFALFLAALIGLTFPGIILGQETFFYRDFGVFGYPLAHYQRECFWRGELPLWNPLNNCGLPFLAQWNTLCLYPPALFYLLFPLSWSLGVFNLGHLFLAGMGMYFLARQWTKNSLAASVAGVLFAFNGLTWHSLMWPNDIAGLGWMPWVIWAAELAWREGGRRMVWAALAGGLQMLAGAPEVILLTWVFVGLLWLRDFGWSGLSRSLVTGRAAVMVLLVAGLAAAQLLPFLDLLRHSQRDAGFSSPQGWAMPLSGVANLLAPLFHCYATSQGVFVQHEQYWAASYYLGVGAMLLAAVAVRRPRSPRVCLLLLTAVASVWMALGGRGYLYSAVNTALPVLGFMRYPIKFIILAVLAVPLLAACGIKRCDPVPPKFKPAQKFLPITAVVMLALLVLIAFAAWKYPAPLDDWPATWHNIFVRAVFLALVAGVLTSLQKTKAFKSQVILRFTLLLLLWADVRTHAPNLSPTVARSVYDPGIIRAELKLNPPSPGESRFMATRAALEKVQYFSLTNAVEDYLCRRLAFYDNCNLLEDLPKIDGFYSLYLKETMEALSPLYQENQNLIETKGFTDFLGIAHISANIAQSKGLDWATRDSALPLITAGQTPIFIAESNTIPALYRPDFNPREMVFLPASARALITAARTDAKIISQRIEAQRVIATVETAAPAMLVVAQAYYQPWRAYVDGEPVKLWRANAAFQAVEVPAGRHEIKLAYVDRVFQIGAFISLVSLLSLPVIWFRQRRQLA